MSFPDDLTVKTGLQARDLPPEEWNDLVQPSAPYLRWEWFAALEANLEALEKAGFRPSHIAVYRDKKALAIAPLYWKRGDYMEFARGHHLAKNSPKKLKSYPERLVGLIPLCPIPGYTFLMGSKEKEKLYSAIFEILEDQVSQNKSLVQLEHIDSLFEMDLVDRERWLLEKSFTYRWWNQSYESFEAFLERVSDRVRRNIRIDLSYCEREKIEFAYLKGEEVSEEHMKSMMECYRQNHQKYFGNWGFLTWDFWKFLLDHFRPHFDLVTARSKEKIAAMAFLLEGEDGLFGRWWGSLVEIPQVYFAVSYYIPMKYAIENKKKFIDAGYQGKVKLWRGFESMEDTSLIYTKDPFVRAHLKECLTR